MTEQELFSKCLTLMLKQGCRSRNEHMCLYRDDQENKCPAGMFIKQKFYRPHLENGYTLSDDETESNPVVVALIDSGVPLKLIPILGEFQQMHDVSESFSDFVNWMVDYADKNKLFLPKELYL